MKSGGEKQARHLRCPACGKLSRPKAFQAAPHRLEAAERGRGLGRGRGFAWRTGLPARSDEIGLVLDAIRAVRL